jgi:glyoxylase-like metal-dependent hydrolase (beta-lactamase superfamily II)
MDAARGRGAGQLSVDGALRVRSRRAALPAVAAGVVTATLDHHPRAISHRSHTRDLPPLRHRRRRNARTHPVRTPGYRTRSAPADHGRHRRSRGCDPVLTPGHTPGHLCVLLTLHGESAWLVGGHHTCPIQVVEPTWQSFGDVDPKLAQQGRDQRWDQLRRPDTVGTGAHFPDLRFGNVSGDTSPRWVS